MRAAFLALLLTALPLVIARNSTLGAVARPGCVEPVLARDVPQEFTDRVAQFFIGSAQGSYSPFISGCRGYNATAMEACFEDEAEGQAWEMDVAIACTQGQWANGVSALFINGRLVVDADGNITVPAVPQLGTELVVTEPAEPDSPLAQRGQNVTAAYTLHYVNGTFIESDDAFAFVLGEGHVIRGWDEPIQLMRVGEQATLVVRPIFAYAARTDVSLPPNSTLLFNVTVLAAEPVE
ncbi:peptidylprolyl isomerase [Chlorella sorokiniana]|uniref:peptidylprolyl isomerase n=1 Tax=Chlorella sorokiniana TaxID=3076 RepID=A0A2P6TBB5_CHLSO|nr:peptidylprolyl isomerase [Chlorella sorokiniana]|eukprot:PRW05843.1 peptidylprolyl isomerase [Chlorella sorokiniana]